MVKYPAIVFVDQNVNIKFIDFDDCVAQGRTMEEAIYNAKVTLAYQLLLYKKEKLIPPRPSENAKCDIMITTKKVESEDELPSSSVKTKKNDIKKELISFLVKLVLFLFIGYPFWFLTQGWNYILLLITSVFLVFQTVYVFDSVSAFFNNSKPINLSPFLNSILTLELLFCFFQRAF